MERTLLELNRLQELINLEKAKYEEAIRNNQKFEDVKQIYLTIKQLQQEANVLMQHANKLHRENEEN